MMQKVYFLLLALPLAQAFAPSALPLRCFSAPSLTSSAPAFRFGSLPVSSSACPSLRMAGGPAPGAESEVTSTLGKLFKECSDWGLVRFITVNPSGSVLETAADIGVNLNHFQIPNKGQYLTIASDDKTFECHMNLDKAAKVTFSQEPAKIGGHMLHVMRVKDSDDAILLSAMLQYDPSKGPGNYFGGKVKAFEKIMEKYGPEMEL